jgi:site-specific DNA-methyltransferase (adenine-specific)
MRKLDAEGRLHFTSAGGIRLKRYLEDTPGIPLQTLWTDIPPINSQAAERLGYPTQKPLALLERW